MISKEFVITNVFQNSCILQQEINMTYQEYVNFLLLKYGPAQYDYFRNKNCKSKNPKISRVKEGLYCHHIDEDKAVLLSEPHIAQLHSFTYQNANRLVYCNILEHLLLHIKIVEERKDVDSEVGIGGTVLITEEINTYIAKGYASGWKKETLKIIDTNYTKYILILIHLRNILREDPIYSNHPLFQDKFLCFTGQSFCQKVWGDMLYIIKELKS